MTDALALVKKEGNNLSYEVHFKALDCNQWTSYPIMPVQVNRQTLCSQWKSQDLINPLFFSEILLLMFLSAEGRNNFLYSIRFSSFEKSCHFSFCTVPSHYFYFIFCIISSSIWFTMDVILRSFTVSRNFYHFCLLISRIDFSLCRLPF